MRCTQCKSTYGLYTYNYLHKGVHESYSMWVPKEDLRELGELEKSIEKRKDVIGAYLEMRYGEQWGRHFERMPKKMAWGELTNDGDRYPRLATFYSHVRNYGMESILKNYLRYDSVDTVSRILNLDDTELMALVAHARRLEERIAAKKDAIRKA